MEGLFKGKESVNKDRKQEENKKFIIYKKGNYYICNNFYNCMYYINWFFSNALCNRYI